MHLIQPCEETGTDHESADQTEILSFVSWLQRVHKVDWITIHAFFKARSSLLPPCTTCHKKVYLSDYENCYFHPKKPIVKAASFYRVYTCCQQVQLITGTEKLLLGCEHRSHCVENLSQSKKTKLELIQKFKWKFGSIEQALVKYFSVQSDSYYDGESDPSNE